MTLLSIKATSFRNLKKVEFHLDESINLITGHNGAGKTSFLELIYFLIYGKSPRTHLSGALVMQGQELMSITGQLLWQGLPREVRYVRQGEKVTLFLDGKKVKKRSEVACLLPVQFFDATTYRHLASGPQYRREFLDWGVFHVKPPYKQIMQNYKRILYQRNTALRRGMGIGEVTIWDAQLCECARQIDEMRQDFYEHLQASFVKYWALLGHEQEIVTIKYKRGWPIDVELTEVLRTNFEKDRKVGYTQFGIHRGDLKLQASGQDAFSWLSQGQQKTLAYALYLAQLAVLQSYQVGRGVFLVDDLPAELDVVRQQHLVDAMAGLGSQLIITGIVEQDLLQVFKGKTVGKFSLAQGELEQV